MLPGCRKSGSERAKTAPEVHQHEMVKKSFEESKKVIAAKVNGEPIAVFSVLREMNAIAPQYLAVGQPATPELNVKIRQDALNTLITQELAVQEARKRGMKVTPEAIESEIKRIKADKGSEAGYQEYLGGQGITENELRNAIEQDMLFEMIAAQEIDAKVMVSDAALRERYKKEKAGLKDDAHRQITFEAAKGMLEQKVRAEAADKRMRDWAEELRKNARIEIVEQKPKE
jgi:hypothetical protein